MKNLKKYIALGCSAALIVSTMAGCGEEQKSTEENEEIAAIQNTLENLEGVSEIVKHSSTAGKEEMVYVIMDADGNIEQTIVSEWLKNAEGDRELEDESELTDISVVKGDAEYTKGSSEEQLIWNSDGSDIYYQGKSDKELPVDVKISYELDGKKVSADELAGASGHLKMKFTYMNHESKDTIINGEICTIYQPFMMVSGTILDNETAQNISVNNGSMVNTGDGTAVFGIALPGLSESLGLSKMDIDLPEEIVIEADVTDFSLSMTLTVATNDVLSQLGIDKIDSIDELKADMDQLMSGMNEIVDGTTDLETGLNSLEDSTPELASGVKKLAQGTNQAAAGLNQIVGKNASLNYGVSGLANGLSSLDQSLSSEESIEQMKSLVSGSAMFSKKLTETSDTLLQVVNGYNYQSGNLQTLFAGLSQYAQSLEATQDPTNAAYAGSIQALLKTYQELYGYMASAQAGMSEFANTYNSIDEGVGKMADSVSAVSGAVETLALGAMELEEGVKAYTDGVSKASNGVSEIDQGAKTLNAKVPTLISGISQLSDGGTALKEGIIQFKEEGIQKLVNIVNNDLETYFERFQALQDFAEEYSSYAGCPSNIESSVRFIYKTDAIK